MKKTTLTPQTKRILIVLSIIIVFLIIGVIFTSRTERVPSNPADTIGNTAGNLNNSGLFCELDGKVYFANAYDDGTLYRMDVDEENIEMLSPVKVCNILGAGKYLYYFQLGASGSTGLGGVRTPHSFNRCRIDGSKSTSLVRAVVVNAQLIGDRIYMLGQDTSAYLFRINTDKSNETKLFNYIVYPTCADNGIMYYNGTVDDHYLYAMDTATETISTLLEENVWFPSYYNGWIYYLDLANDYQLRRYHLTDKYIEILSNDRVEAFNVGNGLIYYTTMGDDPAIKMMSADGGSSYVLATGLYNNINMTSQYVYFQSYYEENVVYHAPLGTTSVGTFDGAKEAAQAAIFARSK